MKVSHIIVMTLLFLGCKKIKENRFVGTYVCERVFTDKFDSADPIYAGSYVESYVTTTEVKVKRDGDMLSVLNMNKPIRLIKRGEEAIFYNGNDKRYITFDEDQIHIHWTDVQTDWYGTVTKSVEYEGVKK